VKETDMERFSVAMDVETVRALERAREKLAGPVGLPSRNAVIGHLVRQGLESLSDRGSENGGGKAA
jgi:metal-responsive CopG/Arc/MetJ family transcriptional regulator